MTTFEVIAPGTGRMRATAWGALGVAVALALGAAASVSLMAAIAFAIVVAVVAATALRPVVVVMVLTASVYLEVVAVGGVTLSRLLAPVALLVVGIQWLRGRASFRASPPLAAITAYGCWALASLFWTVDMSMTTSLLASLCIAITYMLAFATLISSEKDLRDVLVVLSVATTIVGVMSVFAFAGLGGSSDQLQSGRTQGGIGDPNFFACVELISLPLMLALASAVERPWQRLALYGGSMVAVVTVLSTLSRGGLIALVVILLAMPFMPARALLGSQRQKSFLMIILVLCLGALLTRPTFSAQVIGRAGTIFTGGGGGGSSAGSGREEIWKAAEHSIADHPITGVGFGAFPSVSTHYMLNTPGVNLDLFAPRPIEAHSAYIGTAADLGVIGLCLLIGIVAATAVTLRRTAVRAFRSGAPFIGRVANACVLSLVAWVLSSMFIETETSRPLWILIGFSLLLPRLIPRGVQPRRRFPQRGSS